MTICWELYFLRENVDLLVCHCKQTRLRDTGNSFCAQLGNQNMTKRFFYVKRRNSNISCKIDPDLKLIEGNTPREFREASANYILVP